MSAREIVGTELATAVALRLRQGEILAYGHRDYCGMGLRFGEGLYLYGEVTDGDLPLQGGFRYWQENSDEERLVFPTEAEFVAWLAPQTDASLSGQHLAREWFRGNQRLTLRRLKDFVGWP